MPETGVYLGFDFGMQYIGIAVGQAITATASPIAVIRVKQGTPNWLQIDELVVKWNVQGLVVGIPYHLDGSLQPISFAAREFAQKLEQRYHLPVYLMDERLTTKAAKLEWHEQNFKIREPKRLDSYAAKIILESWLRSHSCM